MLSLKEMKKRFTILRDIKHVCQIMTGFALLLFYSIFNMKKGERLYNGCGKFYALAQTPGNSLLKRIALAFFENPVSAMVRDYFFYKANVDRDQLSTGVIQEYSDESLLGYGDINYDKGGASLETQQRGLMIPLLKQAISEGPGSGRVVVEIGVGNGDVLSHLAGQYSKHKFVGVDFFTKNAVLKHGDLKNLSFLQGYALNLLEQGKLKGDILFASSTFCVFTPKELKRYLRAIHKAGFSEVILSEPGWYSHRQTNDAQVVSYHLGRSVWFHNWCGYLREAGYGIRALDSFHYKSPKSVRPDISVTIVRGIVEKDCRGARS